MYKSFFKPIFDFVTSIIMLLMLSPIFIIVFILLFIVNRGKPFFFQKRPGKNERIFTIIKFKTMNDKKDSNGDLLPDNQRMSSIGNFIRKASLDEIPQLINVLKGDMSFIGPRPLLPEYLELYNNEQRKRHKVRPGITGLAQLNGRNAISWKKKFEYDIKYVEGLNLKMDFNIFLMNFSKVFKSEGVNSPGEATTTKFKGNE